MVKHCAFCGRAYMGRSECCSEECREGLKRLKEPLCPFFSHERYGNRGAIYCDGGVIRLRYEKRKAYIKKHCNKIDGGGCSIRQEID